MSIIFAGAALACIAAVLAAAHWTIGKLYKEDDQ